MLTLKLKFITPDGAKINVSVPVQIDEEFLKYLGEHVVVPFNGIEDAALCID